MSSASARAFFPWYAAAGGAIAVGPWLSLHLRDAGLDNAGLAAVLVALPLGRLVGAPVWGWAADRFDPRRVLQLASVLATGFGAGLVLTRDAWALAALVLGWAICLAPWFPIVDAAVVQAVGRRYGPVRAVASGTFLVTVVAAGLLRDMWAPAPLVLAVALSAVATVTTLRLPAAVAPAPPTWAALRGLLVYPALRPLLAACALHGATLSAYDQLFAVHLQALGATAAATGFALALGVAAEIGVLLLAPRVLGRVEPAVVLLIGVVTGVPRFVIMGSTASIPVLVAVQALHGLHFGAFWAGATTLFAERAPAALRNTTQSLLPAAVFGAGPLLGLIAASAWLRRGSLGEVYLGMAGVSLLAAMLLLGGVVRRPT